MELLLVRLLDQTVQVDLSWFQVNVLQPRMVENVFQRWPVRGAHGQTPLDEVLALCGEKPATTGQSEQAPVHPVPPPTVSELCPALPIHPLFGRRAGWQGMCQLLQPPTGDEAPPELPVSCRLPKPIIPPVSQSRVPTRRDAPSEEELSPDDVLVLLEGDVPTDHVVEQDAQGPDGG